MNKRLALCTSMGAFDRDVVFALAERLITTDDVEQWWGKKSRTNETLAPTTNLIYACLYLDRVEQESRPRTLQYVYSLRRLITNASRILATSGMTRSPLDRLKGCTWLCRDASRLASYAIDNSPLGNRSLSAHQLSRTKYELALAATFVTEVIEDCLADPSIASTSRTCSTVDGICHDWFDTLIRVSSITDTQTNPYLSTSALALALMAQTPTLRQRLLEKLSQGVLSASQNGSLLASAVRAILAVMSAATTRDPVVPTAFPVFASNGGMQLEESLLAAWHDTIITTVCSEPARIADPSTIHTTLQNNRQLRRASRFLLDPATRTTDAIDILQSLLALPTRTATMRECLTSFIDLVTGLSDNQPCFRRHYQIASIEARKRLRHLGQTDYQAQVALLQHSLRSITDLMDAEEYGWHLSESFHDAYMAALDLQYDTPLILEAAETIAAALVALIAILPNDSWVYWRAYRLATHVSFKHVLSDISLSPITPQAEEVAELIRNRDGETLRSLSANVMREHETLEKVPGGRSRIYRPAKGETLSHYYCVFKGFDNLREAEIERKTISDCEQALKTILGLLGDDHDTRDLIKRSHVPSILAPVFNYNQEFLVALQSVAASDLRTALMLEDATPGYAAELTLDVVCHELPRLLAFLQALLETGSADALKEFDASRDGKPRLRTFRDECIKDPVKHGPFIWTNEGKAHLTQTLREWSKDFKYGRKIDCHHGNILVRRRHYTLIDFHYTRSARPLGYELIQLTENARLLPVTPEGIELRTRMVSHYRDYVPAWEHALTSQIWSSPFLAPSHRCQNDVHRMMLIESLRLLRQASSPEWRVTRPRDAAGMIEHADEIIRYLSAHDQVDISTTATAAMHARRRYDKERVSVSKAAAKILRHDSDRVGPDGWMDTVELRAMLEEWAASTSRRLRLVRHRRVEEALCFPSEDRFEVSKDLSRIRALHGHTINNYAKLRPGTPPPLLFHGTSEEAWIGIQSGGLTPGGRQYVHIFVEKGKAMDHAKRYADPVLLIVDTTLATQMGVIFRQSNKSVWVADCVPAACLTMCRSDDNTDL